MPQGFVMRRDMVVYGDYTIVKMLNPGFAMSRLYLYYLHHQWSCVLTAAFPYFLHNSSLSLFLPVQANMYFGHHITSHHT